MGSGDKRMRILFSDTKEECQISGIKAKGNTVALGRYVAHEGVLCRGVEDITQYTTDEYGNKVEVTEMRPDKSWLVADIKLWLDAQRIPYVGNASKADLLALV